MATSFASGQQLPSLQLPNLKERIQREASHEGDSWHPMPSPLLLLIFDDWEASDLLLYTNIGNKNEREQLAIRIKEWKRRENKRDEEKMNSQRPPNEPRNRRIFHWMGFSFFVSPLATMSVFVMALPVPPTRYLIVSTDTKGRRKGKHWYQESKEWGGWEEKREHHHHHNHHLSALSPLSSALELRGSHWGGGEAFWNMAAFLWLSWPSQSIWVHSQLWEKKIREE